MCPWFIDVVTRIVVAPVMLSPVRRCSSQHQFAQRSKSREEGS